MILTIDFIFSPFKTFEVMLAIRYLGERGGFNLIRYYYKVISGCNPYKRSYDSLKIRLKLEESKLALQTMIAPVSVRYGWRQK